MHQFSRRRSSTKALEPESNVNTMQYAGKSKTWFKNGRFIFKYPAIIFERFIFKYPAIITFAIIFVIVLVFKSRQHEQPSHEQPSHEQPSHEQPSHEQQDEEEKANILHLKNIFVLHLEKRLDRKLLFDFKLRQTGIPVGEILQPGRVEEYCIGNSTYVYPPRYWTGKDVMSDLRAQKDFFDTYYDPNNPSTKLGAYGIVNSYEKLFNHVLDQGMEDVLVFEDDCYFHKDFKKLLVEKRSLFIKNDVVYLGYNQFSYDEKQLEELDAGRDFTFSKNKDVYGFYGIYFKRKAVNALLSGMDSNRGLTIDYIAYKTWKKESMAVSLLNPALVIPEVRDSDNMGGRDIFQFLEQRKFDITQYDYVDVYLPFNRIYNRMYKLMDFNPYQNPEYKLAPLSRVKTLDLLVDSQQYTWYVFMIPASKDEGYLKSIVGSLRGQMYPAWRAVYLHNNENGSEKSLKLIESIIRDLDLVDKILVRNHNIKQDGNIQVAEPGEIQMILLNTLDANMSKCHNVDSATDENDDNIEDDGIYSDDNDVDDNDGDNHLNMQPQHQRMLSECLKDRQYLQQRHLKKQRIANKQHY